MIPALLAIDVGSSRVRALLFAPEGGVLAEASRETPIETPSADQVVIDPEGLWRDLREVIGRLEPGRFAVRGIGVTAQLGLTILGARNQPLDKTILWPDRRAIAEAEEMRDAFGDRFANVAGRPMSPELAPPRLKWLARHRPAVFARIDRVLSLKDYIVFRLTGVIVSDEAHASYSGLFDVEQREWSVELCRLVDVEPRLLSPIRRAADVAGTLGEGVAAALGLAPGVPVAVGASDGTVGTIGAGGVRAGVTVDVAGTTDVILHLADRPLRDPEGAAIVNAHPLPGLWAIGGATGMTGGAVAWVARLFGYPSADAAEAALPEAQPSASSLSGGLLFRPTLAGSRFPGWRPEQRGLIAGIGPTHGFAEIFTAAKEGAAFTVCQGVVALERCGVIVSEVIVAGGLAGNRSALQLRADVLGVPVLAVKHRETSAIGAAMLAGVASGLYPDLMAAAERHVRYEGRFQPDPTAVQLMQAAGRRWAGLQSL